MSFETASLSSEDFTPETVVVDCAASEYGETVSES